MKTKSASIFHPTILILATVLLTGMVSAISAGDRARPFRVRENSQQVRHDTGTGSIPQPVLDETPINPDSFGTQRNGRNHQDREQTREQRGTRNVRHDQ